MNNPGETVYVRWYGNILQGTVVPNTTPADQLLGRMVAVTIPIQGTTATALFMPAHVYETAELASGNSPQISPNSPYPEEKPRENSRNTDSEPPLPSFVCSPSCEPEPSSPAASEVSDAALEAHRKRYRDFMAEHWDHEHNHLHVDFLEEGYQLFRQGIAMKMQLIKANDRQITESAKIPQKPHPQPSQPQSKPQQANDRQIKETVPELPSRKKTVIVTQLSLFD